MCGDLFPQRRILQTWQRAAVERSTINGCSSLKCKTEESKLIHEVIANVTVNESDEFDVLLERYSLKKTLMDQDICTQMSS
jgi:hypothetical protein